MIIAKNLKSVPIFEVLYGSVYKSVLMIQNICEAFVELFLFEKTISVKSYS